MDRQPEVWHGLTLHSQTDHNWWFKCTLLPPSSRLFCIYYKTISWHSHLQEPHFSDFQVYYGNQQIRKENCEQSEGGDECTVQYNEPCHLSDWLWVPTGSLIFDMGKDTTVHSCMHTGSEAHPATYPVVCQVSAVHKMLRFRMCGVQWWQQYSLIHSLTHTRCGLTSSTKKDFFLDGNISSPDTITLEVQTTTVSDNVGHHPTSDKVAHPGRTVASRHADWHIQELSTHPRGF